MSLLMLQVLMAQCIPAVSHMRVPTKWCIVFAVQLLAVISSILSAAVPAFNTIAAARAMHGTSTALYMTSILVLLVELSPKQHLALGIATLSAGEGDGISLYPKHAGACCRVLNSNWDVSNLASNLMQL
jgi:predicted MFS family arabinose efflux permease